MTPSSSRPRGVVFVNVGTGEARPIARRVAAAIGRARQRRRVQAEFERLHERWLTGDRWASIELWRLLSPEVRRRLRGLSPTTSPDIVESVVSDTMNTYLKAPSRYRRKRGTILAWLGRIGKNKLLNALRDQQRVDKREVALGDDVEHAPAPPQANPEVRLQSAEEKASARRRLLALVKKREERAFIVTSLRDAPLDEVAAAIGIADPSPAVQKARTHALTMRLRKRSKGGK